MSGEHPTPAPSLRPGWTAIVGRGTGRDAIIAVLYPATPALAATPPEAA